jgi:amidohydrolase
VIALQSIVARSVNPYHSAVVTVGSFHAGVANNVIPHEAVLKGTARWFDPGVGETIARSITRVAKSIAEAHGASAEVDNFVLTPATINDEEATTLGRKAAAAVVGSSRVNEMVEPTMGAEDFAYMLGVKQGAYIMLGTQRVNGLNPMLHHPAYDFNDAILSTGAAYWSTLVEQQLAV